MKTIIKWVHILLNFKKLTPEQLVPFATSFENSLTVDADIPVANSPVSIIDDITKGTTNVYAAQNKAVSDMLVARQNAGSKTLTTADHILVNTLMNSTQSISHYIEITANTKFPGDVPTITKIINRLGFVVRNPSTHSAHAFDVVSTAEGSATLTTATEGLGVVYHWRWSINQTTWTALRSTHETTVVINALPSLTKVFFQSAVSIPAGKGNKQIIQANDDELVWSDPISVVIP